MEESRQVRRAKERQAKKRYWEDSKRGRYEVYYVPMKWKSRKGVEYTYYKKVIDKAGLRKDAKNIQDNTKGQLG